MRNIFFLACGTVALDCCALTVQLVPYHEYCGNANGWIDCQVSGGVPPYTFEWSNAETTEDIYSLTAGTYSVTVTDFQGTEVVQQTTVLAYTAYPAYEDPVQLAFCVDGLGESTAHAVVDNTGLSEYFLNEGIPVAWPLTYFGGVIAEEYMEGIGTYTLIQGNIVPGAIYQVSYTDATGCPGTIELQNGYEVQWPMISVLDVQGACSSGGNGSIQVALTEEGNQQMTELELRRADHSFVTKRLVGYQATQEQFTALLPGDYWLVQRIRSLGTSFMGAQLRGLCGDSIMVNVPDLGGGCGNVNGTVYMDYDQDCFMDFAETRVPGALLEFQPGPYYTTTNASGGYSINLPVGNYTVQQLATDVAQTCPPPLSPVAVSGAQTMNVGDTSLVPLDAQVMMSSGAARPGFELRYAIAQANLTPATTGIMSTVFTFDPVVSFLGAVPTPSNVNGNVLTWDQTALGAFAEGTIQVRLQIPPDVGLIGSVLSASVTLSTTNNDADLSNNVVNTNVTVTGSFDPNGKVASTSSGFSNELYYIDEDEWVNYTLRFQNTGTDTAFTVIVTDTLPEMLDPSTVVWGANSHACLRSLTGQGVVKFIFPNILLPDSNVNEPASHGFASFRIKPRLPILPGTTISNTANIFFDYNPPVITEPSVLVAEMSTAIPAPGSGQGPFLYPDPAEDHVVVLLTDGAAPLVQLIANDGRRVEVPVERNGRRLVLDLHGLADGLYTVITSSGSARFIKR